MKGASELTDVLTGPVPWLARAVAYTAFTAWAKMSAAASAERITWAYTRSVIAGLVVNDGLGLFDAHVRSFQAFRSPDAG